MIWSTRTSTVCATPRLPDGECWSAAARLSTPSKKPSSCIEDDETFDAGRGSFLNRDGKVQLDAFIMDGATLRGGGVGCVERLRNPVRAARKILSDSPHVYFVAEGAERFAAEHGIALCRNEDLIVPREVERLREYQAQASRRMHGNDLFAPDNLPHDTVGAVALDRDGNIAASTSTGGTLNKAPGRLGDSSLIGCGCYADNLSAAASTTGWGEPIMKLVLGKWAADRVESGNLPEWVGEGSDELSEAARSTATAESSCSMPRAASESPTIPRAWLGRCRGSRDRKLELRGTPERRGGESSRGLHQPLTQASCPTVLVQVLSTETKRIWRITV